MFACDRRRFESDQEGYVNRHYSDRNVCVVDGVMDVRILQLHRLVLTNLTNAYVQHLDVVVSLKGVEHKSGVDPVEHAGFAENSVVETVQCWHERPDPGSLSGKEPTPPTR